jgi:hypothetical protein
MDNDLLLQQLIEMRKQIEEGEKQLPECFQWCDHTKKVYHNICDSIVELERVVEAGE